MNWIKNHSKLIISLFTIVVVAVVLIFYRQWFSVSTLIPTTLLALFFQSTEEQEKLAKKNVEIIENEQKQERFKKMLSFVLDFYKKNKENLSGKEKEIRERLDEINLGEYQEHCGDEPRSFTLGNLVQVVFHSTHTIRYNESFEEAVIRDFIEHFLKQYSKQYLGPNKKEYEGRKYINILKEELPKILNDETFDFEKGELK